MIAISRDKSELVVSISVHIEFGPLPVRLACSSEVVAALLRDKINELMRDKLKAIREEAYQQGWSDKASKKCAKRTWFSGLW